MNSQRTLNHPLRLALAGEMHARPFLRIEPPERVLHLALFAGDALDRHHAWLGELCECFGVSAPQHGASYFFHDFGPWRLKWENHSEFSTYTFAFRGDGSGDFADDLLRRLPQAWLGQLAGNVISAAQLAFVSAGGQPLAASDPWLRTQFSGPLIAGARVMAGGEVWSDFLVQPDGVSRFLLRDVGLREFQAGRLSQRVLEIDTYRMMALLALPVARECQPVIREAEADNYRFSASAAYFSIIRARLQELREERIEGVPTLGEFMERRLVPAMEFCESVRRRQHELIERLSRTDSLLRTRVTMTQERYNSAILASLNKRAELQLRLQHAVEGFSIVAISYYLLGVLGYGLKALGKLGVPVEAELATGLALPLVVGAVWFAVRRAQRALHRRHPSEDPAPAPAASSS
ncbi:DUF3422 domain-containing protein [Thauera aminoaromatica]|uniref:DUF3422 family protein n=1 Tax=Thauera aminoaromatica TaxID=164330 RepID=UPI0023F5733E|nr:DUF3422 domain-containing protein [Thauera aminoaromatica]